MKPRLIANRANTKAIRFAQKPFTLDDHGLGLLRDEISGHPPLLVVIDPIVAYMGSNIDLHRANDTTRFMWELDQLAREFDCAIVAVRHLAKAPKVLTGVQL